MERTMGSTPTKNAVNPSSGWRRMSEKISRHPLKSSIKANDSSSLDGGFTTSLEDQPEIEAILDFRVHKGVDQYLVAWKCASNDLKSTWEIEPVLESIGKEMMVKFWVKTLVSNFPLTETDSARSNFMKKLKDWSSLPCTFQATPKKEPPSSPTILSPAKKRPRQTERDDELDLKPPKLSFQIAEKCDTVQCPKRLLGLLEPGEFTDLLEHRDYEIGEIIPLGKSENNRHIYMTSEGKVNTCRVVWFTVSSENHESLGLTKEYFSSICNPLSNTVCHIGRKKYFPTGVSIREIPRDQFTRAQEVISREEMGRDRHASSESARSDLSTHPPTSPESDSEHSEASTNSPSSLEPELMQGESSEDQLSDNVGPILTNKGSQTDELDPYTCIYCHQKRGEQIRLSSLRQKKAVKKEADMVYGGKSQKNNIVEEEEGEVDEDLVSIEYEVDKILDYRKQEGTNKDEYYIRWKNYTADYDTWEPDENLSCCDKALIAFYVTRAIERRNAEHELRQGNKRDFANNNGTLVPLTGAVQTSSGKKKNKGFPPIPPIPEVILEILSSVNPISDGEVEMAYKLSKTVKKKTLWPKKKFLKVMMDLIGSPLEKSAAQAELPNLRHHILMVEAERRKDLAAKDLKEWERQLNMIAKGKPEIVVENNYDLAGPPQDFKYINDNVLGKGVNFPDDVVEGCDCEDTCVKDKSQCCPGKQGKVMAYNNFKRLRVHPGYPIYECNKRCKCGPECANRVVQDGTVNLLGTKLCIFRTNNDRGWGVKTLKKIKRGTFVCLYAGEIITSEEAEHRGQIYEKELGACYLFDLDYYAGDNDDTCPYTIDATKIGNIAHFINHSCDPNLCVFNVWADCVDQNLPKLAFFALRDINRDEELTYDYGSQDEDPVAAAVSLPSFPPRESPPEPKNPIIKEMDEETEAESESDTMLNTEVLFSTASPAKNRMKLATAPMSAVRRPCLCGAKTCRKVLF